MSTRRGILSTMTAGAALLAVKELASAKDNKPGGGFGATASVSVNSGNNSGNQTFQENQAIITDTGAVSLNQGNASGSAQIQQVSSVESLPSTDGGTCIDRCAGLGQVPDNCKVVLNICLNGQQSIPYVPQQCVPFLFCSPSGS